MVLFIASEVMFFGGMFGAYFTLRGINDPWPPAGVHLDAGLMGVATILLLASSLTVHLLIGGLERRDRTASVGWLLGTFFLGAAFLGLKLFDWVSVDFAVDSHAYGSLFFTMTGAHAVHLLVGLALLIVLLGRLSQDAYRDGEIPGPRAIGYYWHFVDVVWLAMYATLFLIR